MSIIEEKSCFVLDMDGTFYLGEQILPGSLEFFETLTGKGKRIVFFTNNSSKTAYDYVKKLQGMGCSVTEDDIITSGEVTASFLQEHYPDSEVFLLGTPALEEYLAGEGIRLSSSAADIVLAAFDTTLTYEKLSHACSLIRGGSTFLATHPDINCPTEEGFIPDCGAICACIGASTGVYPKYLGKPYAETVEYLLRCLNCTKEDLLLAGDRLYTEIAMGSTHGITTALVLSGETSREDVQHSSFQPDIIVERLRDLLDT